MQTHDLNAAANELNEQDRQALLKVIDLKVEDDMDKVLAKIDSKFDSKFAQFDSKFAQIDSKFEHMEGRISTLYWVVALSTALIGIFIALK